LRKLGKLTTTISGQSILAVPTPTYNTTIYYFWVEDNEDDSN